MSTTEPDLRFSPSKWLIVAVCLSLMLHMGMIIYFHGVDVGFGKPLIDPVQPARFHVERASIDQNQLEPPPLKTTKPLPAGALSSRAKPVELSADKVTTVMDGPLKTPEIPAPRLGESIPARAAAAETVPVESITSLPLSDAGKVPVAQTVAGVADDNSLTKANSVLSLNQLASGANAAGASKGVPGFSEISSLADLHSPAGVPRPPAQAVLIRLSSDVLFEFDSVQLRPQALSELSKIAAQLARAVQAKITVEGHTDTFGTDEYNQKLSEDRAKAVADFLTQQIGSSTLHISWRGYGRTRPIVNPLGSITEQARNRRVEIRVEGEK